MYRVGLANPGQLGKGKGSDERVAAAAVAGTGQTQRIPDGGT